MPIGQDVKSLSSRDTMRRLLSKLLDKLVSRLLVLEERSGADNRSQSLTETYAF